MSGQRGRGKYERTVEHRLKMSQAAKRAAQKRRGPSAAEKLSEQVNRSA
jgi:hypothetical protein